MGTSAITIFICMYIEHQNNIIHLFHVISLSLTSPEIYNVIKVAGEYTGRRGRTSHRERDVSYDGV